MRSLCLVSSLLPLAVIAAFNRTLARGHGLTLNGCDGQPGLRSLSDGAAKAAAAAKYDDPKGWGTAPDVRLNDRLEEVLVSTTSVPGCSYTYVCDGCSTFYLLGWTEANERPPRFTRADTCSKASTVFSSMVSPTRCPTSICTATSIR